MDKKELMYKILKSLEQGIEPHWVDMEIEKEEFGHLAELIRDSNLATNVTISRGGIGNKVQFVHLKHSKLTSEGYDYISKFEEK